MQVVTTELLENLYLQNRFDEMHELMSSKHEISTDVEDKALKHSGLSRKCQIRNPVHSLLGTVSHPTRKIRRCAMQ
jgi:hypothetical protein